MCFSAISSLMTHRNPQKMCLHQGGGEARASEGGPPSPLPHLHAPPPDPVHLALFGFPSRTNTWCVRGLGRLSRWHGNCSSCGKGRGLRGEGEEAQGDWKFPVLRSKCQASTEQRKRRDPAPLPQLLTALLCRGATHFRGHLGG